MPMHKNHKGGKMPPKDMDKEMGRHMDEHKGRPAPKKGKKKSK